MDTHLSQTLEIAKKKSKYDTMVKEIFADKQVTSRILKYSLEEFADWDINDIIKEMDEPIVSKVRVEPGQTNLNKVEKTSEEDNVPGEGKVFYDIRFSVYHGQEQIKVLINIEAQKSTKKDSLGYDLDNRIIYYLGRMISAQKEVEFTKSNYDDLKHVRSIWVCMDSADDEDSINRICLRQENVFGKSAELLHLDKVVGVLIRIRQNESAKKSKNYLIGMLEELFRTESLQTKKKKLAGQYGLIISDETERRLGDMCNLSDILVEKGIEKGIEQGVKQGKKEGRKEGEDRLNSLNIKLIENHRYVDLERATIDDAYRALLYAEFHLDEQEDDE